MRVAMIAPPFLPCPPPGYGGVERVVAALTDHLVAGGVKVTLFAHPKSRTRGELVHFDLTERETFDWQLGQVHAARALARRGEFDIIHNHSAAALPMLTLLDDVPSVSTVHEETHYEPVRPVYEVARDLNLVAISESQRRLGIGGLNWIATVPNGIDTGEFVPGRKRGGYLLHVATLCARKGTHEAVLLARETGLPLVIAGRVDPLDRPFFDAEVAPHVDGTRIRYVGEVYGRRKVALFQQARAFVLPIHWDEPFGLVFVEAMACGTPVLTLDRGAAAEIVQHGRTGAVGREWTDLVRPALEADRYRPEDCRDVAARFTVAAMSRRYTEIYRAVIDSGLEGS